METLITGFLATLLICEKTFFMHIDTSYKPINTMYIQVHVYMICTFCFPFLDSRILAIVASQKPLIVPLIVAPYLII